MTLVGINYGHVMTDCQHGRWSLVVGLVEIQVDNGCTCTCTYYILAQVNIMVLYVMCCVHREGNEF